jgi:hypothetical protein
LKDGREAKICAVDKTVNSVQLNVTGSSVAVVSMLPVDVWCCVYFYKWWLQFDTGKQVINLTSRTLKFRFY